MLLAVEQQRVKLFLLKSMPLSHNIIEDTVLLPQYTELAPRFKQETLL